MCRYFLQGLGELLQFLHIPVRGLRHLRTDAFRRNKRHVHCCRMPLLGSRRSRSIHNNGPSRYSSLYLYGSSLRLYPLVYCWMLILCRRKGFIIVFDMSWQLPPFRRLVKRTVEGRKEEHEDLGSHTQKQHEVGTGEVGQLEQGTQNDNGSSPTIGIIQKGLARHAVHPFLQPIDHIVFAIFCHFIFPFFCLVLVELAKLLTQRKPI